MTASVRPGAVEVVRAGALTTVQDEGRAGLAHLGVGRAGALDAPAAALANRLVGNPVTAAVLETTVTGCAVRPDRAVRVVVGGAPCRVTVDGRPVAWGAAVHVPAGAVLDAGPAVHGLRSYLAFAGGVAADPVLGSRSADLLSGLGPAPLSAGDVLPLGPPPQAGAPPADAVPWPGAPGGPGNRIGLRTEGPPLERARAGELPSEGMVLGAVQVPPDGRPVVFLNDHPTTGGYPVVGVVPEPALAAAAQAGAGTVVRFVRAGR
ncbi:biotin-dependent carboxyltransferase family protein [Streptomyces poriferorum]|uniref:5-oxoprolinase subunit C family protein n=1 Tax=Streptomyces poriferorum TaxID=2798799 RepID=UPI001C5F4878|nr:biotin-dependent carboxyltransferase family protein [Streptomyces poriferorum]MBW5260808.1 biotin-dependent carboxyltransferase family protein [Streptomyces poriferorum]